MAFPRYWRQIDLLSVVERKKEQVKEYNGEWVKVNHPIDEGISVIGKLSYSNTNQDCVEIHIGEGRKLKIPYNRLETIEVGDDSLEERFFS